MDILGEHVQFSSTDGELREGIVEAILPRGTKHFAQVQCRGEERWEVPLDALRGMAFATDWSKRCQVMHPGDSLKCQVEAHACDVQGEAVRTLIAPEGADTTSLHHPTKPVIKQELDIHAYEVVTLHRVRWEQQMQESIQWYPTNVISAYPTMKPVRSCQLDVRRLLNPDPCPVLCRLPYSQIGDQLFVPQDWLERSGKCDPYKKRILPRPAKTIGYMLRLGLATLGEKVVYRGGRDKVLAEGWIANNGILCARCGYVVGSTEFEKCAGMRMRKPGKHIYFADGCSLLEHSIRMRRNFL